MVVAGIVALKAGGGGNKDAARISSFTECVEAGNPIMESDPRKCRSEDGRLFVEGGGDSDTGTSSDAVTVTGTVSEVDASQVSVDGPYVIAVETNNGAVRTVEVPSMGMQICAASDTIDSAPDIEVGQKVSVRGERKQNGVIVPCESADHYVQVAGENAAILSVGETETINGLSVTLEEVVQESRCPVDAECIEGGAITTRVTLANGEKTTTNIASDGVPDTFGGYEIAITDIKPPLLSGKEVPQSDYRITFEVTRQ